MVSTGLHGVVLGGVGGLEDTDMGDSTDHVAVNYFNRL